MFAYAYYLLLTFLWTLHGVAWVYAVSGLLVVLDDFLASLVRDPNRFKVPTSFRPLLLGLLLMAVTGYGLAFVIAKGV